MLIVRSEFKDREIEIEKYFQLLEKLECEYDTLINSKKEDIPFQIDVDLFRILKANGFLLLYNLIESTILNCIVAIFDELSIKNKSYKDVSEKIRKYWLKSRYNHDEKIKKETVVNQFYALSNEILQNAILVISKDKIEKAGSIDTGVIKSIADDLGIALNLPRYNEIKHGDAFKEIKKHRNDLAHGKLTFSAIGRDITYFGAGEDSKQGMGLVHFKKYAIEHLSDFIDDVEKYLKDEKYICLHR